MVTIEEHVRSVVEANRGDEQALVHGIAREMRQLRAALPAHAYLESVAVQLEVACVQELDLPDGTTFDGPTFLRQAALLVRLAIIEEAEDAPASRPRAVGGVRAEKVSVANGGEVSPETSEKEKLMQGEIERDRWKTFLDEFSKRNRQRPTRLEVIGPEVGAQEEEEYLPFIGVSFEPKGSAAGSVEIILGAETKADPRHVSHTVLNVKHIVPLVGVKGVEDGLGFEDGEGGKTLLRFETLPELPETASEGDE
jgi:hypothetical protein